MRQYISSNERPTEDRASHQTQGYTNAIFNAENASAASIFEGWQKSNNLMCFGGIWVCAIYRCVGTLIKMVVSPVGGMFHWRGRSKIFRRKNFRKNWNFSGGKIQIFPEEHFQKNLEFFKKNIKSTEKYKIFEPHKLGQNWSDFDENDTPGRSFQDISYSSSLRAPGSQKLQFWSKNKKNRIDQKWKRVKNRSFGYPSRS